MKAGIHQTMHKKAKTTCSSCGAMFEITSAVEQQTVETCRMCHPVYTGKQQAELKGGRIERFKKRMAASLKGTEGTKGT
jgi:large subunit ribosomal protein L31